jgi:Protein of unknown function (DUF3551)
MRTIFAASALAVVLISSPSVAQTGTARFCFKGPTGAAQCTFQTMAQCESAKPAGLSSECFDRNKRQDPEHQGTVGSGSSAPRPGDIAMPPANSAGSSPSR